MSKPKTPQRKGPPKGTGGRPRVEVDWSKVDGLCRFHATAYEIADYLAIHHGSASYDTLDRRSVEEHGITFAEYVKQKHSGWCKIKLRQLQFKAAESGNVTMLIWLGKQHLGQSDKQDLNHGGQPNNPVVIAPIDVIVQRIEAIAARSTPPNSDEPPSEISS